MNITFNEKKRREIKEYNLSKNDIINKIKNIKTVNTPIIKNYYNKNYKNLNINNTHLIKKNLTYENIYDYNYENVNISEKKIKHPLVQLKKDLFETDYSSFISKNSKNLNSQIYITGLNSSTKRNVENNYINIFSEKNNIINTYTDNNTKSSSKNINNNSSLKKYDFMNYSSLKSFIHFNQDKNLFNNSLRGLRENVSSFMEKSKIIRKEKIINQSLESKIFTLKESKKNAFNLINIRKDEYLKNLKLLNEFEKNLDKYLRYLETQKNKEYLANENLKNKIKELQNCNYKLQKKINICEYDLKTYTNMKQKVVIAKYNQEDFSIFFKAFNEYLKEIEKYKNKNKIFLTKSSNINIKESSSKKLLYNRPKDIINEYNINENKEIHPFRKYNSTEFIRVKNKKLKSENKLKDIFENLENKIIKKINIFDENKYKIFELKNKLMESNNFIEGEYQYYNLKIKTKAMQLYFLKKKNKELKNKIKSKNKIKIIDNFKNKLDIKIYNILSGFNKEINIEKNLCIRHLFYLLKMKEDDFFDKMKITKLIYMLKIIELFWSFLNNLKNKYLNEPQLKIKYENASKKIEREKYLRMIKLNKDYLRQKQDEKKMKLIQKSTQIRFFSYKKYDIKSRRKNKKHLETNNINNINDSKMIYEPWLTYT